MTPMIAAAIVKEWLDIVADDVEILAARKVGNEGVTKVVFREHFGDIQTVWLIEHKPRRIMNTSGQNVVDVALIAYDDYPEIIERILEFCDRYSLTHRRHPLAHRQMSSRVAEKEPACQVVYLTYRSLGIPQIQKAFIAPDTGDNTRIEMPDDEVLSMLLVTVEKHDTISDAIKTARIYCRPEDTFIKKEEEWVPLG